MQVTAPGAAPADIPGWFCERPSIDVVPVRQPVLEALGHHPESGYGEQFWLPLIGPSARWAHRRLTAAFQDGIRNYQLDLATFAAEIGLGARTGRRSPVVRTLTRLVNFHLAEIVDGQLGVHTTLPPLTRRQAHRLPAHLAARHHQQATLARTSRWPADLGRSACDAGR